jgi:hypothetical protein
VEERRIGGPKGREGEKRKGVEGREREGEKE